MSTVINNRQNNWDDLTGYVLYSYNNTEHSSTQFCPNYLVFGRDIDVPFDLCMPVVQPFSYALDKDYCQIVRESLAVAWSLARENIERAQASYKFYHDLKANGSQYAINDVVYVLVPKVSPGHVKKFSRLWHGPYVITKLRGLNCYVKALGESGAPVGVEFVCHLQRVKKALAPGGTFQPASYRSQITTAAQTPGDRTSVADNQHHYNTRSKSKHVSASTATSSL
jgi:hypothetical protein